MRLATLGSVKLPGHSIRLMAQMLEDHGLDSGQAFSSAQVPRTLRDDPNATVSGLQELAFQRAFVALTPDRPEAWLELGSRYRLLSHAHPDYALAMLTAPTCDEALRVGLAYADLYYMLAVPEAVIEQGRLVGFRSRASELPAELHRFCALRDVGVNIAVTSELWGARFPFESVALPLVEADLALVRLLLPGVCVTASDSGCCWRWSVRTDLQAPPQSDPMLHKVYLGNCDRHLLEARQGQEIGDRVWAELLESDGRIAVSDVAHRLGMSVRTLQRRLGERNANFRDLVQRWRHRRACELLATTDSRIAQIATELGYDSPSSFNLAFRRNAGISPTRYRRQARGEVPGPAGS